MSKGTPTKPKRPGRGDVSVDGPWLPISLRFLRSRAWAELSPHAAKLLMDLCAELKPRADGNGDLSAAPAVMIPKGWASKATLTAALQELKQAELVAVTRQGARKACTLYAVTLYPLACDLAKLDHGPGAYRTTDWQNLAPDRLAPPTADCPAKWKQVRKNAISPPATGEPKPVIGPPRGNPEPPNAACAPATGPKPVFSGSKVPPPRDTSTDNHLPASASRPRAILKDTQ